MHFFSRALQLLLHHTLIKDRHRSTNLELLRAVQLETWEDAVLPADRMRGAFEPFLPCHVTSIYGLNAGTIWSTKYRFNAGTTWSTP